MTLNNSMSITPSPPGQAKGAKFEHGSVLGGKTRDARVSSQWKSTPVSPLCLDFLGFFRVKRDLSMGYEEKPGKKFSCRFFPWRSKRRNGRRDFGPRKVTLFIQQAYLVF
jgi:hypothetical protein